jgi:glyoxylase-like metal-dependent hydrolase (beta-lactamase superfamily II)
MREPEWAFWTSDQGLAKVPPVFAAAARKHLPPIRDRLTTVTRETEVAPDVSLVPAEGHTPGHAIAVVHPGREQLHFISDTALHPVHFEEPSWETDYDMDRVPAAAARRAATDRVAAERALVLGFHFVVAGRAPRTSYGRQYGPATSVFATASLGMTVHGRRETRGR